MKASCEGLNTPSTVSVFVVKMFEYRFIWLNPGTIDLLLCFEQSSVQMASWEEPKATMTCVSVLNGKAAAESPLAERTLGSARKSPAVWEHRALLKASSSEKVCRTYRNTRTVSQINRGMVSKQSVRVDFWWADRQKPTYLHNMSDWCFHIHQ